MPYSFLRRGEWIGVDLDGTLAKYAGFGSDIGEPIEPMLNLVKHMLENGVRVKIFTARAQHGPRMISVVQDWLESVGLPRLPVTNVKTPHMRRCYDDRAIQVEFNTGRLAVEAAYELGFQRGVEMMEEVKG